MSKNKKPPVKKFKKSGPWSVDEKKFIVENCQHMSYLDIADKLQRNPDTTLQYIAKLKGGKNNLPLPDKFNTKAEYDIKASPLWKEFQKELSPDELEIFLYHWERIITQFRDDVLPTEEIQVIDMIKLEILISRSARQQKKIKDECERIESEIMNLKSMPPGDPQINMDMENNVNMLTAYRGTIDSTAKEYVALLQRKENILKELKGTRAERIKQIESSKQTFIGWIQELLRNKQMRMDLGLYMEKMRIAIDLEKVRLMEPHSYADGIIDYPRFSSETIEHLKQEEKNEGDGNRS